MKFIFLAFLSLILIPHPVSAYLDPGFGSMVWQIVAAVVFGMIFTVKMYWLKIKNFFRGIKK
jgi:hypothetical protein